MKDLELYDFGVRDYDPFGMLMVGRNFEVGSGYRYGFQDQEVDDEFLGGAISFNFRIEDPRLGRFFSIDPLTAKYPFNSPYSFSENSVIAFRELEGLEKYYAADGTFIGKFGDNTEIRIVKSEYLNSAMNIINSDQRGFGNEVLNNILYNTGSKGVFATAQEAAEDWGKTYNGESIMEDKEFASTIYELTIDGQKYITYTDLNSDEGASKAASSAPLKEPKGTRFITTIHSHAGFNKNLVDWDGEDWNNQFSTYKDGPFMFDIEHYEQDNFSGYGSMPNGSLLNYDVECDTTNIISTDLPSDPTDPDRKNNIDPSETKYKLLEK